MKLKPLLRASGLGRRAPLALWLLDGALRKLIPTGTLEVRLPDGETRRYGTGTPAIAIVIRDWPTLRRIAVHPDLALGEAWMEGGLSVEKGDLYGLIALCLENYQNVRLPWLWRFRDRLRMTLRRFTMYNPIPRSRRNVAHHYDLGDDLYDLFLDAERQYSCAYFETSEESLEIAQVQKMRHIAAKLRVLPGQKVLDIGSGWGGLGMYLAHVSDAQVTGVTLSVAQQKYATDRARTDGLNDRVRFDLRDYRHQTGRFDRIVSVGMFEHVGVGHYGEYFGTLANLLDTDGVALVHTIGSARPPRAPDPWITKYIFPGGYVPSLSEIVPEVERAGLVIADIEVLRLHYAETLKSWRDRFMAHWSEAAAQYDERFCRMWEFYLASCEAGFRHNFLVVFQIQLAHRLDAVPMTRDYMESTKRQLPDLSRGRNADTVKSNARREGRVAAE
ncbi:SAM-dependent methyltransferase [Oricola indica]|jgi:cyclopropane-fatty-acyl-phospholipid synthase|uniref:SAM-dependent methyltransferase n=1 Tax=Oricola indica TaxID=2872591 RepID=UPI000C8D9B94|nr:cyclopropane-fatty-acyl-phospholipid synthase family protein [Oricola indica]MAS04183.1 SAM-dependent methyltransferase [Ahrensia sp.]